MRALKFYLSALSLAAAILFLPGLWYISPYIYSSGLVSAVETNDAATVGKIMSNEYRVRLGGLELSEGLKRGLDGIESTDKKKKALILSATKDIFSIGVANGSISPDAWVKVLQGKGIFSQDILPPDYRLKLVASKSSAYGATNDIFRVEFRMSPTGEYATVVLSRQGWFRWRATEIEISSISLLMPIRL